MWGFPKIWVPPVLIHLCLFLFWILTTIIQYIGYPHLWKPPFSYGFPMVYLWIIQHHPSAFLWSAAHPLHWAGWRKWGCFHCTPPKWWHQFQNMSHLQWGYTCIYIYIHIIHRINIYIYNYIYYIQWWESEIWTHIQLKGSRSIKPTKIGCHQSVNERLSLEHLYNTLGMGLQFSIFRFYIFPYHIIFPLQATLDRPFWYFLILVSSYTLEN